MRDQNFAITDDGKEILRDGARFRVPLQMRDALRKPGFRTPDNIRKPDLTRPEAILSDALKTARHRAYIDYARSQQDAWKSPDRDIAVSADLPLVTRDSFSPQRAATHYVDDRGSSVWNRPGWRLPAKSVPKIEDKNLSAKDQALAEYRDRMTNLWRRDQSRLPTQHGAYPSSGGKEGDACMTDDHSPGKLAMGSDGYLYCKPLKSSFTVPQSKTVPKKDTADEGRELYASDVLGERLAEIRMALEGRYKNASDEEISTFMDFLNGTMSEYQLLHTDVGEICRQFAEARRYDTPADVSVSKTDAARLLHARTMDALYQQI